MKAEAISNFEICSHIFTLHFRTRATVRGVGRTGRHPFLVGKSRFSVKSRIFAEKSVRLNDRKFLCKMDISRGDLSGHA